MIFLIDELLTGIAGITQIFVCNVLLSYFSLLVDSKLVHLKMKALYFWRNKNLFSTSNRNFVQ